MTRFWMICATVLITAGGTVAQAQIVHHSAETGLHARAFGLKPGEFAWVPGEGALIAEPQSASGIRLSVSLTEQRLYVYRDERLIGVASVSTGKRGSSTPKGTFPVLQKRRFHRSNKYSNAPMPYMQRLTWTGIALHSGHNPGRPASHGCIRLPNAFAKGLFAITQRGTLVSIAEMPDRVFMLPYDDFLLGQDNREIELAFDDVRDVNVKRLDYATVVLLRY